MPKKISESVKRNLPLYKGEDYTGKKIENWTVLGFGSYSKNASGGGIYTWKCRCSCGNERDVVTSTLLYGRTKGCLTCANSKGDKKDNPNWKGYGKVSGTVLQKLRMSARKRARYLEVDVDCEYLDALWELQGGRCIYSNRELVLEKSASVDRIDSSLGYTKGNVQWVHVDVNRAKWDQSHDNFLLMCKEIASFNA